MSSLLLLLGLGVLPQADDHERIAAFLKTYCFKCHGPEKQKSKRRFDRFTFPLNDAKAIIELQEVVDQLNLGEMPPQKADQPAREEAREIIAAMTRTVAAGHRKLSTTGGRTILRRLNRREYRNTIRDLLGVDMTIFDPTDSFPKDQVVAHLDNVGDSLKTSGYLLDQYVDAADEIVEKVFRSFEKRPERTWTFKGPFRQQPEIDRAHKESNGLKWMTLYECMNTDKPEGAFGPLLDFAEGVPFDGIYEIRVLAEAKNRKHPYDPRIFMMDPEVPFRLGIVPGDAKAGKLHIHHRVEPLLAETVLEDDKKEWKTFRVRLEAGLSPRFTFPNGQINIRRTYAQIMRRYPELLPKAFRNVRPGIVVARKVTFKYGKMPQIRIHEVRIRGPLADARPSAGHRLIFGDGSFKEERTREILARFASRAYRRPVKPDETDRVMTLVDRRKTERRSAEEALKDGIKAVLCSPSFLYLSEPSSEKELPLHALASRLAYFLWATMPDEELRKSADSGALAKPEELTRQVRRMLRDEKLQGFLRGFLDSWLNLRALGDMPPDRSAFQEYYSDALEEAMRRETQLFILHLLRENRPVSEVLSADYTFANRSLARLYGIGEAVKPEEETLFRKVEFSDPNRGGLLGQGSVLTVSANGIETSPVVRGVWLLENVLGVVPPPPPDDVPAIDPDVRGATTIRDVLNKHRNNPACYECHRRIDPLGFALENFDPIGRWRTQYTKGKKRKPVDASGELPSGQSFKDIAGLKKILVERKEQFVRALAEKLLSYGCGRRMEPLDRPHVDGVLAELAKRGGGFRDLIELVVASPTFRSK